MTLNKTNAHYGIIYGGIAVFMILVAGLIHYINLPLNYLPACTFKNITGIPCLTCGGTRSIMNLSHLHLLDSFLFNPLVFLGTVTIFIAGLISLTVLLSKNDFRITVPVPVIKILLVGGVIINWLYLILIKKL
ncbi:MAG: DUF2752 domain-containing protein [Planctomycetes bacterium]|nr:DUF2752 domain-containing protein [Planctomycetota bacterium]